MSTSDVSLEVRDRHPMRFVKMTEEDFENWSPKSKANYARDKVRANSLTEKEALELAERDFQRHVPEGFHSKDNFFYTMRSNEDSVVGYLWFGIVGTQGHQRLYICDIFVEREHRGKGFGREAMLFAESEARKLGLKEIGLHVFGFNKPAIALYESLGFETTDLVMAKKL